MSAVLEALSSYTIPSAETFVAQRELKEFETSYVRTNTIRWFEIAFLVASLQEKNGGHGLTLNQIVDAWGVVEDASYKADKAENSRYAKAWGYRGRRNRSWWSRQRIQNHLVKLLGKTGHTKYISKDRVRCSTSGRIQVLHSVDINLGNREMWDKIMQIDF